MKSAIELKRLLLKFLLLWWVDIQESSSEDDVKFNFLEIKRLERIQLFQEEMYKEEFLQRNAKNFGKAKCKPLQVDTKKLQAKYNAIKRKCREIKDRPRRGSGLARKCNPEWYEKIGFILGDTNTDLNKLVSTSLDTSCSQEVIQNDNKNESFEDNANDNGDKDLYDDSEDDECNDKNKENKVENVSANKKKAIVVKPHKKRKIVPSQTQALSQLAGGTTKLIESQEKRHKEEMDFEKE